MKDSSREKGKVIKIFNKVELGKDPKDKAEEPVHAMQKCPDNPLNYQNNAPRTQMPEGSPGKPS